MARRGWRDAVTPFTVAPHAPSLVLASRPTSTEVALACALTFSEQPLHNSGRGLLRFRSINAKLEYSRLVLPGQDVRQFRATRDRMHDATNRRAQR